MKKGVKKKFNISNKLSYTIIVVLAVLLLGVSVYAYGTSAPSTFGHSIGELEPPAYCGGYNDGYLVYQQGWNCVNEPSVTGYEIVSSTSTGILADAVCPSGKVVVGGGCLIGSLSLASNYPFQATSDWRYRCTVTSNPASTIIQAYAICVNP